MNFSLEKNGKKGWLLVCTLSDGSVWERAYHTKKNAQYMQNTFGELDIPIHFSRRLEHAYPVVTQGPRSWSKNAE